jgi:hypothetical protein
VSASSSNRSLALPASSSCSRRTLLRLASGVCASAIPYSLLGYSQDFWNKKDPGEWTHEEIERLTTDSPWAKPVKAEIPLISNQPSQRSGRYSSGQQGNRPTDEQLSPKFQGVVRWASAQPMIEALHLKIPAEFADYYVISVSGMPIFSGEGTAAERGKAGDSFDALKEITILQAHGKEVVHPGLILPDKVAGVELFFGFFKRFVDLSNEKLITFSTRVGPMEAKARFNLKEMVYRGQLAI